MRCMSVTRALSGFTAALVFALAFVPAASAAPQQRISTNFNTGARIEVADSVQPRARAAADLGPAPEGMKLSGMSLRFSMSDAQSAALDQLLADERVQKFKPLPEQIATLERIRGLVAGAGAESPARGNGAAKPVAVAKPVAAAPPRRISTRPARRSAR